MVFDKYTPTRGLKVYYRVVKNRHSAYSGGRRVDADYIFERNGFDNAKAILLYSVYMNFVIKKGHSYQFPNGKKIAGRDNAIAYLESKPILLNTLKMKLVEQRHALFALNGEKKRAKVVFAEGQEDGDEATRAEEQPTKKVRKSA